MSVYAYIRPRNKTSRPFTPTAVFAVVFDSRSVAAPFCGRAPKPAAAQSPQRPLDPYADLSPADMRRIDAIREDAYADALPVLGEEEATLYAVAQAEEALTRLRMGRKARTEAARKPYTQEDCAWWFQNASEPDYDAMAEEARMRECMEIGAY